jgi:hypothetical protein
MPHITQPSKEQVRAYMVRREHAGRPPPAPDEVRRQLGWRLSSVDDDPLLVHLCTLLPATMGQLAALIALNWIFYSARPILPPSGPPASADSAADSVLSKN